MPYLDNDPATYSVMLKKLLGSATPDTEMLILPCDGLCEQETLAIIKMQPSYVSTWNVFHLEAGDFVVLLDGDSRKDSTVIIGVRLPGSPESLTPEKVALTGLLKALTERAESIFDNICYQELKGISNGWQLFQLPEIPQVLRKLRGGYWYTVTRIANGLLFAI